MQRQLRTMFTIALADPGQVLNRLLPSIKTLQYSLHPRPHDRIVPRADNLMRKTFLKRMLYIAFSQRTIIVLYCIVLYCIVLYCIVLYCIVLYCIVLYCIVFIHFCSASHSTSLSESLPTTAIDTVSEFIRRSATYNS